MSFERMPVSFGNPAKERLFCIRLKLRYEAWPRLANRRLADDAGICGWLAFWQRIDMLHAADNLAPDGILPVKECGVVETDEKLAVGGVRIIGPRHRANATHMRFGIEFLREIRLGRSAHAGAVGTAALRHEAGYDAVEFDAVVKAFTGQFLDPRDMIWGKIGAQFDDDIAAVEAEGEGFVGHDGFLESDAITSPAPRRSVALCKAKIIAI